MSKATHTLAMAGMALVAGAMFGASPAAAAPAAPQVTASASSAVVRPHGQSGESFGGYYSSERICERVGRAGEFVGRWYDHDCDPVWWGPHRGWWILNVERRHGGHHGHLGGWHGGHHGGWHGSHHGGWHGSHLGGGMRGPR